MRCLELVWILVCYVSSDQALGFEDEYSDSPVPDFTDYDDVPENNFSIFFKNKEVKNEYYDKEPLIRNGQYLLKVQETKYSPVAEINKEFLIVSATKNAVLNADNLFEDQDDGVSYASRNQMKYKQENFKDSQDLILRQPDDTLNNFFNAEYQNNNLQPALSERVLSRKARQCWPWPICTAFQWLWEDVQKEERKKTRKPYNRSRPLDIPALVNMVEYVAWDYETKFNLSQKFQDYLKKFGIPTCESIPTTTTQTTTPSSTINFNDARLVGKCFVCGLKEEGIPRSSACSDAFSGDFIPLVKVDTKARGQIASFRKYCRYLDIPTHMDIPEEPQSTFGRFTGGCSVRWADLTTVYTQRTCRNQRRPVTGKHFASKRMAKLEMAITDLENGCIISPMATLTPVSRGISLYARFHACVCTGSWCNGAHLPQKSITAHFLLVIITYIYR